MIFQVHNQVPFLTIGLGLILFSGLIALAIRIQKALLINSIIIQDGLWVVASTCILILNPFGISSTGNFIIAGVGLVVLILAILQFWALRSKVTP